MERKKQNVGTVFLLFLGVLLLLLVLSTVLGLRAIQNTRFEERVNTTNILMEKIAHHVKSAAGFSWETVHTARARLRREQFIDENSAYLALAELDSDFGHTFWLIDNNGQCYSAHGKGNEWPSKGMLITGNDEFLSTDIQSTLGDAMAHYVSPFEEPLQAGALSFTHVVLVKQMSELDDYFDIGNLGAEGISFIIRTNGAQVYRHNNNNNNNKTVLPGVYNIMSAFQQAEFHKGASYEQFQSNIENGVNNTVLMTINGGSYYLSCYHLGIDDWVSLMMIPESNEVFNAAGLAKTITRSLFIVFANMLLFVGVLVAWVFFRNQQTQKRINEQLQKAVDAERAANIAKTSFLSSMSHDIRTPLNAIVGVLTLAKRRVEDADYMRDALSKIATASNQLVTLINDILDISKIESGEIKLNMEPVSVREFCNRIASIITPTMEEKGHSFTLEIHDILHDRIRSDGLRMSQIYLNLLSNAAKYTEQGGKIHAEVYEEADLENPEQVQLVMLVQDDGMGISPEFQDKMYNSFSRAIDTRTNSVQGSGLGLYICKQLVELLNGTILCDSNLGQGTTFTVKLPLQTLPSVQEEDSVDDLPEEYNLHGLHLLVVEDNNMNWRIARDILKDEGITADRAENGYQCLEILSQAEERSYDAILMDVEMPVMDGRETTRHIRSSDTPWIRDLPILAATANAFAEDIRSCLDAGMDDHIAKPLDVALLLRKLTAIRTKRRNQHGK